MYRRGVALLLTFLLSFSLISEPLQAYAATTEPVPSADIVGSEELPPTGDGDPYEVESDTVIYSATAEGGTSFTVEIPAGSVPEEATLNADLLDPESDEYADAMLSAWISFNIDPEKDLFQMVPYDIYFTSLDGERIPYDGEATVTMTFDTDPFGGMEGSRFISLMDDSMESAKIEAEEIAENVIRFDVPSLSILSYAILEKAQPTPGSIGSIDALLDLPQDEVGAAYEVPEIKTLGMVGGENWYFDIYYVGEDDYNYVEYNHDFNLKYQIEIHVDQNYKAGEIEITIPKALMTDRNNRPINPSQIAVPEGTPEEPRKSAVSQFNYYDDGEGNLVFFNYCDIESGTNNAWQVLYKNIDVMEIIDLTVWDLTATAKVTHDGKVEEETAAPLSGLVDTTATLTSVTKVAFSNTGTSYGPGLYTENQVRSYAGGVLPEWCSGDKFKDYKYVLWKITLSASASQPYSIFIKETMNPEGKIVGGEATPDTASGWSKVGFNWNNLTKTSGEWLSESRAEEVRLGYYLVTAYPKDSVKVGDLIENTVEFTVHPIDEIDEDTTKSAYASWKYEDYNWIYAGDIIGIDKWTPKEYTDHTEKAHTQTFPGWLEVYKGLRDSGSSNKGVSLPFEMESVSRSYKLTHETVNSTSLGQRIPGRVTRVTTVDDAVYGIPGSGPLSTTLLTGRDYYFERVHISQHDLGYDVWESATTTPEALDPSESDCPGLQIYVMYATTNPEAVTEEGWELVAVVPWDPYGVMEYDFTPEQIAKMPYRIKVVHDTINYVTYCDIDVDILIRQDSPVMKAFLDSDPNMATVQIENLCGVFGQLFENGSPYNLGNEIPGPNGTENSSNGWYHDYRIEHGNYSEPGLVDFTANLYNVLPMRDCAFCVVAPVEKAAKAAKTHSASNDIINGRMNVIYNITAHDGWRVGNVEIGHILEEEGYIEDPGRNHVVFYDLLPYGMQYDPSYKIIAGRISNIQSKEEEDWVNPMSWNAANVSATATVVDTNYKLTGRTLVKFDIIYTGKDNPSSVVETYDSVTKEIHADYFESWGVSFQGYFDWDDIVYSDKSPNVAVFMPGPGDSRPLLGADDEVFDDDGNPPTGNFEDDYRLFGANIDNDPATQKGCVLYAYELVLDDTVTASQSDISKLVRADSNEFGTFEKAAVVDPGGTYTYEITVKNTTRPIKDIVIFDRLENANKDRIGSDGLPLAGEPNFEPNVWHGTFLDLITDQLEKLKIQPVIYYNTSRTAKIPNQDGSENPTDILTSGNGWIKAADYKGDPSAVQAIAVDLSKTTDN